jgi:hypothetical protein
MIRRAQLVLSLVSLAAVTASALGAQADTSQAVSTRRCPVMNGIRIGVMGLDTARAPRFTLDTRTTLDTTFVLNVTERRWQEPRMTASLDAGIGDTTGARWHACTGVSISMRDVTLVLRDVHGQVRYKVDLTPFHNIQRLNAPGTPPRR